MSLKDTIANEVDSFADKLLKRPALLSMIKSLEEMETTLIQGLEQFTKDSDPENQAHKFSAARAQLKIDALRKQINQAKGLEEQLGKDIEAFLKI